MKILKIFGLVVGIHAVALIMIFANPGCSSNSNPPAPTDTAPKIPPAPAISLPDGSAPAADGGAGIAPAPVASDATAPVIAINLFSPTRPGTLAADALETQPVAGVTPATTYVVAKGDSLWSIAKKNHVRISVLARANGISSGSPLHLGQKLLIPGAAAAGATAGAAPSAPSAASARSEGAPLATGSLKYRVRPGETLGAIARKFRVRVGDLATANNISDPQKIHVGQELVIPSRHAAGAGGNPPAVPSGGTDYGAANPPPPADSDLDAGLKPADAGDVPVIKLDDSGGQTGEPKQP